MPTLTIRGVEGEVPLVAQIQPSQSEQEFPILLPKRLIDPTDDLGDELKWYVENYARHDSFAVTRAQSVETRLHSYGSLLAHSICLSDAVLSDLLECDLTIEIDGYGGYSPRLAQVYWEMLEDVCLWDSELRPRRVSVVRIVDASNAVVDQPDDDISNLITTQQHILAVSVRTSLEGDIPYRLITRAIYEAIDGERHNGATSATFEIVRPGTFAALETALAAHPAGYYDIVHFDLHGFIEDGNAFLKFVLSNETLTGVDNVPLFRIVHLLAQHGIRAVILNACQSASEDNPTSNIARSMVEQGTNIAIGMRFEILDSAAEIFIKNLYYQLLQQKKSIIDATRIARSALRKHPQRRTKFNTDLDIQDALTPILFTSCPIASGQGDSREEQTLEVTPQYQSELLGREDDVLAIETKLLTSNILLLNGSAGTGKTYFIDHLCRWWKATRFIKDFVILDCSKMGNLNVVKIQAAIAFAFTIPAVEDAADVLAYLNHNRCLVVIDSLDATQTEANEDSVAIQTSLRRFLRKIRKSFAIVISRHEEEWIKAAAKVTYTLKNLDMKSSLQLATKRITESRQDLALASNMNSRFLEQCIYIVDGNPLAIELLMKSYVSFGIGIQAFYNKLTDGSVLDQMRPAMFEDNQPRGLKDAEHAISRFIGPRPASVVTDTDFRLLRPFWRTVPLDLAPYRLIFLWAKARISEANEPIIFTSQLKYTAERMTNKERDTLHGSRPFEKSELASLASIDAAFELCEQKGFMSRTRSSAVDDEEIHMTIHPLLSLALRQQKFAVPGWLDHSIEVAFQRYHYYRSRHWPNAPKATPSFNMARAQMSFEFGNYITANNFALVIKADRKNTFLMKRIGQLAFCLPNNPRRMPVILDLLDRFLATYAVPLTKGPSLLLSAWSSGFHLIKKTTKSKADDVFSDNRGMIEMLSILGILYASQFASALNIERDYSPMLEDIAKNFLPNSDYADVNLPLLRSTRINLIHLKNPSGDRTKAMLEALGRQESEREAIAAELPELRKLGPLASSTTFHYDTLDRVKAAATLEDIEKMEQELLGLLEEQLDGVELGSTCILIYESLGLLAFRRGDLKLALRHYDKVLSIAKTVQSVNADGIAVIVKNRESVLEVMALQDSLEVSNPSG